MLRAVAGGGSGGGGGGGTIGGAVTGGTAGSVLFVDGSEKLGQDNPDFTYISDRLSTPFLSVTGNGAASVSPFLKTGTVFTGGSTTTTLPYELHQPTSASAVTTWSTSGTVLGMNLASGFAGNFVDFHVNGGSSLFRVSSAGGIVAAGASTFAAITATTITASSKILSSYAGAASAPVFQTTGALYAAGTGTTNFPQIFQQPSAATAATTWSTAGTFHGINAASGFSGNFIDYRVNGGSSVFSLSSAGTVTLADAANIVVNTTTGTKIGTATSQKLGFFNATPVVQQTGDIVTALGNLGLVATGTIAGSALTSATLGSGVGFSATSYSGGTISSGTYTPASTNGNFQHITNGGAFTLAPPSTVCTIIVEVLNNGSAGTITTSGFTKVTGDALTTTNGSKFQCFITKSQNYSSLNVVALQ